jgi:hypothetical protein
MHTTFRQLFLASQGAAAGLTDLRICTVHDYLDEDALNVLQVESKLQEARRYASSTSQHHMIHPWADPLRNEFPDLPNGASAPGPDQNRSGLGQGSGFAV